jgi:hypothetical protein
MPQKSSFKWLSVEKKSVLLLVRSLYSSKCLVFELNLHCDFSYECENFVRSNYKLNFVVIIKTTYSHVFIISVCPNLLPPPAPLLSGPYYFWIYYSYENFQVHPRALRAGFFKRLGAKLAPKEKFAPSKNWRLAQFAPTPCRRKIGA